MQWYKTGEQHHRSKLTEKSVLEIRALSTTGMTQKAIAIRYGISQPTVGNILSCATWNLEKTPSLYERILAGVPLNRNQAKTHCKRGHLFSTENTLFKQNGRECKACVRLRKLGHRLAHPARPSIHPKFGHVLFRKTTPQQIADIHRLAMDGHSLRQIAQLTGVHVMTASRYVSKLTDRPPCGCGQKAGHTGLCTWFTRGIGIYPFIFPESRVEGGQLLLMVNKLVPRELPEEKRQDICQNLILRVLSGEITEDEIGANVRAEINKANKFLYEERSLDEPYVEGDKTFGQIMGIY